MENKKCPTKAISLKHLVLEKPAEAASGPYEKTVCTSVCNWGCVPLLQYLQIY